MITGKLQEQQNVIRMRQASPFKGISILMSIFGVI